MSCCKNYNSIEVKFVNENKLLPRRTYEFDAGADLFYSDDIPTILQPGERKLFATGVAMSIPEGFVGLIWPRSGNAVKKGIDTMAGVIDPQYRGEIKVLLINHSEEPQEIKFGDKIAQIIIQKCYNFSFVAVEELTDSARGEKGFGSSGS